MAGKKFYIMDLWFSKCLRESRPSKLEQYLIYYIRENTIFKKFMDFKSYYEIDQECFGDGKCNKAKLVIKTLLEKNQIIFGNNRIAINFDVRSWNLNEEEQYKKINEVLHEYDV
jgi:hypothetical protein